MEYGLAREILLNALVILGSILLLYLVFCWLLVWESRWSPRRLGEIGWKRVDYAWILIGSLGLVLQFIQVGLDSKLSNLKMEEGVGRLVGQYLNIAAAELSDSSVCLQAPPDAISDHSAALTLEFAEFCRKYKIIRPANAVSTTVDIKIFRNFDALFSGVDNQSNTFLKARIDNFKRAFLEYERQAEIIQVARNIARIYGKYVVFLKFIAAFLLIVAVAIRLAKVTGEIRMKTRPIKKG